MSKDFIGIQDSKLQDIIIDAKAFMEKKHVIVFGDDELRTLSAITGEHIISGKSIAASPVGFSYVHNTIQVTQLRKIKNEEFITQLVILVNDKGVLDISFDEQDQLVIDLFDYDDDWSNDLAFLARLTN